LYLLFGTDEVGLTSGLLLIF